MSKPTSRKVQYLAGLCASFAYTFTGAVNTWPSPAIPKFKNGEASINISDAQISWAVSLSALGALPGCYLGRELSERVGRRKTILLASLPGFIGAIIILFTNTPVLMCCARFLMGIGNGITAVVTMIYLTEIADKEIRGALGMLVQVMNNFGSLVIYGVGPFVSYSVLNSIVLFISVFYAILGLWLPESPYYYLACGKVSDAKKAYMVLKGSKDTKWAEEQLDVMRLHVLESMENKSSLKELFGSMKYRKAIYIIAGLTVPKLRIFVTFILFLGCSLHHHRSANTKFIKLDLTLEGLKVLQYMTGSFAIQSYLEVIFRQSSSISGPYASIVYGFVQLAAGIGATFLTGYFGRRILMLTSSLGVALSLTLVGIYFFIQDSMKASEEILSSISFLPLVGVLGFNILYASGLGNLPYVMQAELFPINVKTLASSMATMVACFLAFGVTKSYQGIKDVFGHYTVFWSFASIAYFGVFFIYFFVPETKDKTLEEVQENMQEEIVEVERLNKPNS